MFILQNVLFPDKEICECKEMYYHSEGNTTVFDGYFNIFSCAKWLRYTRVASAELAIAVTGDCLLSVYSEKGLLFKSQISDSEQLPDSPQRMDGKCFLSLPELDRHRFIWFSITPLSDNSFLKSAMYITRQSPLHEVKLAGDICTFRREEYVRRNSLMLQKKIMRDPASPLYGRLDIYIVDNGRTLDIDDVVIHDRDPSCTAGGAGESSVRDDEGKIFLIPNSNAGGSGGFTRGMLEILQRKKIEGYTHIILMDDDAVLEPDAFVRCFALLSFMRPEYEGSCVAGTLWDLDIPYMQDEAGALYQNGNPIALGAGIDLRDREQVLKNEEPRKVDYAGWWWSCFPLTFVREDNLPLPFFIHFDDMEYGLRNKNGFIYLNGIGVWHSGFEKRRPQTDLYYGIRNRMIANAVHGNKITKWAELRRCLDEMIYCLMKYQYSGADLVLHAVRDFAAGPKSFAGIDPEKMNDSVREMADVFSSYAELSRTSGELAQIQSYAEGFLAGEKSSSKVSRLAYLLTLNGWLLPAKKGGGKTVCCSIFGEDLREIYRAREAVLVDPYAAKGTRVTKSYLRAYDCLLKMVQVTCILLTKYNRAADGYRDSFGSLSRKRFWNKYLKL